MAGIGNKRRQMCRAMTIAKKRKQQEEQQRLSEALLARVDDESEVGVWEVTPSEDSGSEVEDEEEGQDEEECEITDSGELEEGENWRDNSFFTELLANRENKEDGNLLRTFNERYQRLSNPSQRTLYRRAANQKELAKAASGSAKITTFFQSAPSRPAPLPPLTPEQILVQKRKSAYLLLEKKINSKKEVINKQTTVRHQAVLAFLQLQLKPLYGETRQQMSFTVARTFGKGVYFSRKLVTWENEWMRGGLIEVGKRGCFAKTKSWFNDEGVQLAVREWIAGKSKVEGINIFWRILPVLYNSGTDFSDITGHSLAKAIGSYLDSQRAIPILEDTFGSDGNRIRIRTARRWLKNMGFDHGRYTKGVYVDGHERPDVIKYRNEVFIPQWQAIRHRCNGRGSLTPDSEPGLWTRAWGRGQIRTRRGENGQGKDVEWAKAGT